MTFLLAPNPGESPRPLARAASGGELSRAMLAARVVLSDAPPTLVFDEVDAGIGGEAGIAVGRLLATLGARHQVLCVTHLAQVAAFADMQVVVEKAVVQESTKRATGTLLESVAAAAVREGLADALYTRLKTPIGRLLVVSGPEGVVRIAFESEAEDVALAEVAGALGPRLIGSDRELAGPATRSTRTSPASRSTCPWTSARSRAVPARGAGAPAEVLRGQTVSYGELAARAGNPKAARAVGTACARNPVPIVVPCHRVRPARDGWELPGRAGAQGRAPGTRRVRAAVIREAITQAQATADGADEVGCPVRSPTPRTR